MAVCGEWKLRILSHKKLIGKRAIKNKDTKRNDEKQNIKSRGEVEIGTVSNSETKTGRVDGSTYSKLRFSELLTSLNVLMQEKEPVHSARL